MGDSRFTKIKEKERIILEARYWRHARDVSSLAQHTVETGSEDATEGW